MLARFILGTLLLRNGVGLMSFGLAGFVGERAKKRIAAMVSSVPKACCVSAVFTALVQSSSLMTVLAVGLVDAGVISFGQAVGVIYGANIGTTLTLQIMTLPVTECAPLVLASGLLVARFARTVRGRNAGRTLVGAGLLFLGLRVLNSGALLLQGSASFRYALYASTRSPVVAMLFGVCSTMLVHSSSATVGVALVLAKSGLIDLTGAVCLMLGDNIGTCVSAYAASRGRSIAARRTACAHLVYNVLGVAVALLVLPLFVDLVRLSSADAARQVANSHAIFNILSALLFIPITSYFVRFIESIVRGPNGSSVALRPK